MVTAVWQRLLLGGAAAALLGHKCGTGSGGTSGSCSAAAQMRVWPRRDTPPHWRQSSGSSSSSVTSSRQWCTWWSLRGRPHSPPVHCRHTYSCAAAAAAVARRKPVALTTRCAAVTAAATATTAVTVLVVVVVMVVVGIPTHQGHDM
jgi:hypothetical protein